MTRGSSLNFKAAKKGAFEHNDRTENSEVEYLLAEELRLENEFDLSAIEAKEKIKKLWLEVSDNYQKNFGQKLQSKTYLWEAVINLENHHTLKDLKKLVKKLEKITGFTAVQSAIHRDEGREGKDKEENHVVLYNYHAHVVFFTLDKKQGVQLYRRDISKPLRRIYRTQVEEYRRVHKRLTPPYHQNKVLKLKKKPKWSEVNIVEINKEIRRQFKNDGHIVYDRERLSYLQTIVAEELSMPRGTVSVESEAKRLGVVLNPDPAVRKEHKPYRAGIRAEERIERILKKKYEISEQIHIDTNTYLQNNLDYFVGLLWLMAGEYESIKHELVEQSKIIPKENEIVIDKQRNEEIGKIEEKDTEIDSLDKQVKVLEKKHEELNENISELQSDNNTLITKLEDKKIQIISDAKILNDSQDKIEILENKVQKLEKLLEPTGYEIEGESVSEILYDYIERQRHALNYKSSRVDSLEEKLDYQKERVEARNKLMNEERIRHERVEKEFVVKEEAQNMQIQELKKDVFSETWTRKDKNGVKHKSKNINVVKQLEKNNKKLNDQIKTLELLAYSKSKIPVEFDENDKPIKFEKETWKEKVKHAEEEASNLMLENEWQDERIAELEELTYYDEQIWDPEIGDFSYTETSYKEKNEILEKELDEAKKIIETMRDYDVPISQLSNFWDETRENILNTQWKKRVESIENETQQGDVEIKPEKDNLTPKSIGKINRSSRRLR